MITYEMLCNCSAEELKMLDELKSFADEAQAIEGVISRICMQMSDEELVIKDDDVLMTLKENGGFEVYRDGIGQEIECSAKNIFELLQAEYVVDNELPCGNRETRFQADLCKYFRSFLEKLENNFKAEN